MASNPIEQIIQGIGAMVELWVITYKGFKQQGFKDQEATEQTKAFMSVIMDNILNPNIQKGENDDQT